MERPLICKLADSLLPQSGGRFDPDLTKNNRVHFTNPTFNELKTVFYKKKSNLIKQHLNASARLSVSACEPHLYLSRIPLQLLASGPLHLISFQNIDW